LLAVSKDVVRDAQPDLNKADARSVLIPAVFGSRVAGRFSERTGIRLKQTALSPRNPKNAPDAVERSALEMFAAPDYPREKAISEATAKSGMVRLMYPLYITRQCLDCHGEPKGALDKTGYPREGLRLGQNAGAISVAIHMTP
jgi:general secretion pathway protein A